MNPSSSSDSLTPGDEFSSADRKSKLRLSFNNPEKQRQPVNVQLPITGSPAYLVVSEQWKIAGGVYSSGELKIDGQKFNFTAEDLTDLGEIGRGAFGTVNKMLHRDSRHAMAVKRIRSTIDEREQKNLLMELAVIQNSCDCPCIVQFYGMIFKEGDCWICMELMGTSLDKYYKFVYEKSLQRIPEILLSRIAKSTLTALNYLKERLKIIHRDVKPSNILLDRRVNIKLCDFGISGKLVNSIAKTRDAGCEPYMAPERIDPKQPKEYDVRSDVWSLGITLMELATGKFPYPKWNTVFEQITQVVDGEAPRIRNFYEQGELGSEPVTFSDELVDFVNTCLIKDVIRRPKYTQLLNHPFVAKMSLTEDLGYVVHNVLDQMTDVLTTNCYEI